MENPTTLELDQPEENTTNTNNSEVKVPKVLKLVTIEEILNSGNPDGIMQIILSRNKYRGQAL